MPHSGQAAPVTSPFSHLPLRRCRTGPLIRRTQLSGTFCMQIAPMEVGCWPTSIHSTVCWHNVPTALTDMTNSILDGSYQPRAHRGSPFSGLGWRSHSSGYPGKNHHEERCCSRLLWKALVHWRIAWLSKLERDPECSSCSGNSGSTDWWVHNWWIRIPVNCVDSLLYRTSGRLLMTWIVALHWSSRKKPSKSHQLWVLWKVCYFFALSREPLTASFTASSDFPDCRRPWLPRTDSVSVWIGDALPWSVRSMSGDRQDFLFDGNDAPGSLIFSWKQHIRSRTMVWVVGSAAGLFDSVHECSTRRIASYRIDPVVDRPTFPRTHPVDTTDWIGD